MVYKRAERVAQQLKTQLSKILLNEVRDPRIGALTVTEVCMSDDLSIAKIYLVAMGARELSPTVLKGLNQAKGFIKKELAQRIELRHTPELLFFNDEVFVRGGRIEEIFANINREQETEHSGNN